MTASQDMLNWLDDYVTGKVRAAVMPLEDALVDSAETVSAQALVIADRDRQVAAQAVELTDALGLVAGLRGDLATRDRAITGLRALVDQLRAELAARTGKPTAANTAAIDRAELDVWQGDLTLGADQLREGLLVVGRVNSLGGGKLKHCIVLGPQTPPSTSIGCITATTATTLPTYLEDVLVDPTHTNSNLDGIRGHDINMRGVRVRNTVDGLGLYNSHRKGTPLGVDIDGLLVEELAYFTPAAHADNQSHNDCIQIHGGTQVKARRFRLVAKYGSVGSHSNVPHTGPTPARPTGNPSLAAIMYNQGQGVTGGHDFADGWIEGGYLPVNCSGGGANADLGALRTTVIEPGGMPGSPPVTVWLGSGQKLDTTGSTHPDGSGIHVRGR